MMQWFGIIEGFAQSRMQGFDLKRENGSVWRHYLLLGYTSQRGKWLCGYQLRKSCSYVELRVCSASQNDRAISFEVTN